MPSAKTRHSVAFGAFMLCALAVLLVPAPVRALAQDYTVGPVSLDVTVGADGSLAVVEQRTYVFAGSFNGIYWDVPRGSYKGRTVEGEVQSVGILEDGALRAFAAADDLGMYLMPEANMWSDRWMAKGYKEIQAVGHGLPVDGFVQAELDAIVSAYGNHPCFLSLGIGNELGETKWKTAAGWMERLREKDPRRLYFVSTARAITDADDIYLSHKIDGVGPIRCRIFPHTDWDYEDVYSRAPLPTVAHEIGQWPVYPIWDDLLPKFTGVLRPYNIERFFRNAQKMGALRFTRQYHAASAKANRLMYKDETESFLRTPSCSGVEMLNAQDFTGQGEALVGWRDPFYDLKRGFADEPRFASIWGVTNYLARFAKYQWTTAETFRATMQIRNLSPAAISAGTEFSVVCA